MDLATLASKVYELLALYGMKVIGATVIFVVGRWVAKGITRLIKRMMEKSKTEKTLVAFVGNLSYVALLAFVIIAALNQLGIQTASFMKNMT
jgi:small conductance mechanosensitive channel